MPKLRNNQFLQHLSEFISRMPLWSILIIPFLTIIIVVVSTTTYLNYRSSQLAIDDIAQELLNEISVRIETQLTYFFEIPMRINQNNAAVIRSNLLDVTDLDAVTNYYWEQAQIYDSVSSIYFGNPEGGLISVGHDDAENFFYVLQTDNFTSGVLTKYNTDSDGNLTDTVEDVPEFDAVIRPWYIAAVNDEDVVWTEPYILSTEQDLAMASSLAIKNEANEVIGVTSVDIFLSHITEFLSSLSIGQTGQAYIIDHAGTLIGTSSDAPIFLGQEDEATGKRLLAIDSEDDIIASSAMYIMQDVFPLNEIPHETLRLTFEFEGEEHYLLVSPFHNTDGLDLFIVISIPKADFFGNIQAQTQVNLLLTVLASIMAIIIGSLLTLQLLRPITNLSHAVMKIAKGDWSKTVAIHGFQETRNLAEAFNIMSAQLRKSFGKLESGILERTSALSLSEARYRAIVENQTEVICRFTPYPYTITFVNQALCRYVGKDEAQLLDANFITSVLHSHIEDISAKLATLSPDQPSITLKSLALRHDGKSRWMQWVFYSLNDEGGEITEIQAVGRDITEEIAHEQALKNTLERQTELSRLKSQFITTVSHEFRTPMAIILNSSQMLEAYSARLNEEQKERHFKRIEKQIFHMTDLLNDLLTINRETMDKTEFNPQALHLVNFVENIIADVQATGLDDVIVKLSVTECDQEVIVDHNLLRLILTNLISNAIKFSPSQSIVNIDVDCKADQVQFIIKDKGIGVPVEARDHILEPFYRADNVETIAGTGLGLAIVKQSVEKHGGKLSFKSIENKGTTFTVVLPQNRTVQSEPEKSIP